MLDFTSPVNPGSVVIADALVSKAYSQDRETGTEVANNLVGDAGLLRSPRTGGDDNALGQEAFHIIKAHLIISDHYYLLPQLAQVLEKVIGKAVIIIY